LFTACEIGATEARAALIQRKEKVEVRRVEAYLQEWFECL